MTDDCERIHGKLCACNDPKLRNALFGMWSEIRDRFCGAPASAKPEYHHCYEGGLARHSLEVHEYLGRLAWVLAPERFSDDDLLVAALFHDLGKVDTYERTASGYRHTDAGWPNHAQRSLFILAAHRVPLSQEVYQAILLHDGQYIDANRRWAIREPDLALLVHWADMWSAKHPAGRGA